MNIFSDVLLIINGFIIISLYEVLKIHVCPERMRRGAPRGFERVWKNPIKDFFLFNTFVLSGDEGIRTPDPLLARQVLSQLSYAPIWLTI